MKRSRLVRKTPLRADPEKTRAWKNKSQKRLPSRTPKRRSQEATYGGDREGFLREHPICPVTGERTTDIHHSAKREGGWLNLKRYWIATSRPGHVWIEENKREAEIHGLMHRTNKSYAEELVYLKHHGIDPDVPMFYQTWDGKTLKTSYGKTDTTEA